MELKFKREVGFLGRNGYWGSTGIDIYKNEYNVEIRPITTKDKIGSCCIEIPKEELSDFIQKLNLFL